MAAARGGLARWLAAATFCVLWAAAVEARSPAARMHRHLKRLNKPAVKSIESPDGDIIDCVHISHQPAFDHPLLKNHTLQLRPAYHPEGLYDDAKSSLVSDKGGEKPMLQLWHQNGRCQEGTVPIRRTKKDDLFRASSMRRYGRKQHTAPNPMSIDPNMLNEGGHQHAIAYVEGDKYYGAKATINVWEPKIQQPNEFSLSQLWILGGSFGADLNSIEAGWQVSPDLYGDNNTRLFTYWTSDAYQATGCYNILCSGFIQINSEIAMGASIFPISHLAGSQYDISILIWKWTEATGRRLRAAQLPPAHLEISRRSDGRSGGGRAGILQICVPVCNSGPAGGGAMVGRAAPADLMLCGFPSAAASSTVLAGCRASSLHRCSSPAPVVAFGGAGDRDVRSSESSSASSFGVSGVEQWRCSRAMACSGGLPASSPPLRPRRLTEDGDLVGGFLAAVRCVCRLGWSAVAARGRRSPW